MGFVDSGANGGISNGRDMCLMYFHPDDRCVNISGVGNHKITDRRLATFCVVIETDLGPVLGIFHNYAFIGEQVGTIHSQIQLISYGNFVCDKPRTGGVLCMFSHS